MENITKTCKKSHRNKINEINIEAKKTATKLQIDHRVQKFYEAEAFIIVKYHKDYFPYFSKFRLINPSKSEIGKISNLIFDNVNKTLIEKQTSISGTIVRIRYYSLKVFQIRKHRHLSTSM